MQKVSRLMLLQAKTTTTICLAHGQALFMFFCMLCIGKKMEKTKRQKHEIIAQLYVIFLANRFFRWWLSICLLLFVRWLDKDSYIVSDQIYILMTYIWLHHLHFWQKVPLTDANFQIKPLTEPLEGKFLNSIYYFITMLYKHYEVKYIFT